MAKYPIDSRKFGIKHFDPRFRYAVLLWPYNALAQRFGYKKVGRTWKVDQAERLVLMRIPQDKYLEMGLDKLGRG